MSKLGPLIPLSGLGGGVRRLVSGADERHVLVVTDKMVHLYNVPDNCVAHTWYADTGTRVVDVCVSSDNAQQVWILTNASTVVKADSERNKIEDCVQIKLNAEAVEIVNVENTIWVVFANGGVRHLEYYLSEDNDGDKIVDVVNGKILDSNICVTSSGHWTLTHLVENGSGQLSLVRGRLVLDTVTGVHSVEDIVSTQLSLTRDNMMTWHLDPWSQLSIVTTQHDIVQISPDTGRKQHVLSIPGGSKHVSLCHVSRDQLAVMGTLTEGGYLQTLSTTFNCVTGKCQMKTTSHSGKGLFLLGGVLYVCASSRVMRVTPSQAGLDNVLGSMASTLHPADPASQLLNDNVLTQSDMPEYLILDCIVQMLESKDLTLDRQMAVVSMLVSHEVSHPVMNQQITERLSLDQVVRLLNIFEKLLLSQDCCQEDRILEWINMLVTCHYLHMVISKDPNMEDIRMKLQETVSNIQETLKNLTECKVSVKNLLQTKVAPIQVNNQAYAIEVIQI